jgi:hypothetical protein
MLAISSCSQTPETIEPTPSPTSALPGHSYGNPAPYGKALKLQYSGAPEFDIKPTDYMEIKPEEYIITETDGIVVNASPGNPPPEPGNEYKLIMLSFYCIKGAGEDKGCHVPFTGFKLIDSNGNEYSMECDLFSRTDDLYLFNRASYSREEDTVKEGETMLGGIVFEVPEDTEISNLILDSTFGQLCWGFPIRSD